jgi:hypothetical protein
MHKIILCCSFLLLLSAPLYAEGSHISYALTANKIENGNFRLGGELGIDLMKSFENGIELGAGMDVGIFMTKSYESLHDEAGQIVDLLLRAGYSFHKTLQIPFALRGGAGYGLGQIGNDTMKGEVYDISGIYAFNEKYALGLKYKKAHMTLTRPNTPSLDYAQIGCYLALNF